MPPAARIFDPTAHPGLVSGPGASTVLIAGLPAARQGDMHACAFPGLPPHPPTPIATGSSSVMIGGLPAARLGDQTGCGAVIMAGAATVLIGG